MTVRYSCSTPAGAAASLHHSWRTTRTTHPLEEFMVRAQDTTPLEGGLTLVASRCSVCSHSLVIVLHLRAISLDGATACEGGRPQDLVGANVGSPSGELHSYRIQSARDRRAEKLE